MAMTTKEKALAYDKALQVLHKYDGANIMFSQALKEEMFPELKESEDEKIRKALLNIFGDCKKTSWRDIPTEKIIAWLEKQKATDILDAEEREFADNVDSYRKEVDAAYQNGYNEGVRATLEEQGKQKPADKTEPKFKVGDKIQFSKGCGTIMTIEKIENGEYVFANNMGHTTIEWGNKWYLVERNHTLSEEDE